MVKSKAGVTVIAVFNKIKYEKGEMLTQERQYVMRYVIWYHLYNLKNVKNSHGGLLLLVKLQAFSLQLY